MKFFNSLAVLLIFPFLSCNQAAEIPKSAQLTGNQPIQNLDMTGLVFKSVDGGHSWLNTSEGLPGDKLEGSFFVNDQGVYLRTGNYLFHSISNNKAPFWEKDIFPDDYSIIAPANSGIFAYDYHQGHFRKKLYGSSIWSPVYENFELKGIIDVFETPGGTAFIVCDRGRGLFRSADNGKNWTEVTRGVLNLTASNGVLLANSINGVIRSTDDGETWETVISEGGVGIDIAPIDGGFAAITYNAQSETRRVRVSYDGGKTWQAIDAGLPPSKNISSIVQQGDYFFCGHPNGIFRSADKGKTWQLIVAAIDGKVFKLSVSGNILYAIPGNAGC